LENEAGLNGGEKTGSSVPNRRGRKRGAPRLRIPEKVWEKRKTKRGSRCGNKGVGMSRLFAKHKTSGVIL